MRHMIRLRILISIVNNRLIVILIIILLIRVLINIMIMLNLKSSLGKLLDRLSNNSITKILIEPVIMGITNIITIGLIEDLGSLCLD